MATTNKLSIKDVVKTINKNCKDWNILDSGNASRNLKKLRLYSLGFDLPFKGGLPYGQIISVSGVEHSGKSTLAVLAMARYQKENPGKVCIYVDSENTMLTQADYFQSISGISYEEDKFLRYDCTGRSAEEIFSDLIMLQATDEIGMIVIDSCRALISQADLDNDFTKDNGQRASVAKSLGKFIKMMMMYLPKRNNILLTVNQVTIIKDMFSTTYEEPCGYSLKYYPSVKIRCSIRTFTCKNKDDIKQSKADGEVDGIQIHYAITKSRIGGITKEGGFITIRYEGGIDTTYDFIKVATTCGFLQGKSICDIENGEILKDEKGKDLTFSGEKAMHNYLYAHPDLVEKLSTQILKLSNTSKRKVNLLDEETLNELFQQEEALCPENLTIQEALAKDGVEDE